MQEYSSYDATALAGLVNQRDVTPLELVDATVARIDVIPALHLEERMERPAEGIVKGMGGLHLTSPVVTLPAIARLAALARPMRDLHVVTDHPDAVDALAVTVEADRMDREYHDCEDTGAFETALMVDASVISANSATPRRRSA